MLIGICCICFRVVGKHDHMSVSKCDNLFPHLSYMLALDSHWLSSEPYHFWAGLQCRNDTWQIGCKDTGTRLLHLLLMRSSIQALITHVDTWFSLTRHRVVSFFFCFVLCSTTLSCKGTWWHAPLFFLRLRSSLCRLIFGWHTATWCYWQWQHATWDTTSAGAISVIILWITSFCWPVITLEFWLLAFQAERGSLLRVSSHWSWYMHLSCRLLAQS